MGTPSPSSEGQTDELEGNVLEVLEKLLAEGDHAAVLGAVKQMLERLEKLEQMMASRKGGARTNEGISKAQLRLALEELAERAEEDEQVAEEEPTDEMKELAESAAERAAEKARERALKKAQEAKRKKPSKPFPANLSRQSEYIDVPADQRACPCCGEPRERIGYDATEQLEYQPARLYVKRAHREKLACKHCERGQLVVAPRPDKIVDGGQFGCSFGAQVLHDKYERGLPLNRQSRELARLGYKVPTSTLCDQVEWVTDLLQPLYCEAIDQVLASPVMHIDGTGLKTLDRSVESGKKMGVLWGVVGANEAGPQVVAYTYASSKHARQSKQSQQGPHDILARRKGIVIADADSLFISPRKRSEIIDGGCNMHARRYFVKALDRGDKRAALALGAYKRLYQIEEDLAPLEPDKRREGRREQSNPIFDTFVRWCKHLEPDEPPQSPLGRAIAYFLRHQLALRRYIDHGEMPMDNVAAEHLFVPVALTRKNFLFAGSEAGGERAAVAYTILRCCRVADVDPVAYLTDILAILSRRVRRADMPELMPAAWKARQPA